MRSRKKGTLRNVVCAEADYTLSDTGRAFAAWLFLDCGHLLITLKRRGVSDAVFHGVPMQDTIRAHYNSHVRHYVEWTGGKKTCTSGGCAK